MLTYIESIPELVTHHILPVSQQVTHRIINAIGCKEVFQNKIMHTGDFVASSVTSTDLKEPILDDDRCMCEIEPKLNVLSQDTDIAKGRDFIEPLYNRQHVENKKPVFTDLETGTYLICHETPMSIGLTYKLSFKDRVVAFSAYDRILSLNSSGGVFLNSNYLFTYPIPENIYSLIFMVYTMTGKPLEGFMNYLRACSNGIISSDHNRSRPEKSIELVVRSNTSRVYTDIKMSGDKPTADKDNHSAKTYDIEFTVSVQLQRPHSFYLKYPIVVNNKCVPSYAIMKPKEEAYQRQKQYHKYFPLSGAEEYLNPDLPQLELVRFPWYDEWDIPNVIKELGYTPFLSAIVTLDDPEDPNGTTVIDLAEPIDGRKLTQEIVDIMRAQDTITLMPSERIWLSFFSNHIMQTQSSLTLTNGTILTIPNRDIKDTYHIVLSENKGIKHGNLEQYRVGRFDIVTHKERLR